MRTLSWAAVMVMLTASPVVGAELLVPDGYPTIQAAVSAAADSDVVIVAPGLYALDSPLDLLGKAITVRSARGPAVTFLDFSSSFGVVFQSGESRDTIFEGFTVTGVGILCDGASPTIRDVHVAGLSSTGIGIRGTPPHPDGALLEHCSVRDCVTTSSGGGIAISAPAVLDSCVVEDNECDGSPPLDGYGAGIFIESSSGVVVVRNCLIRGNRNLTGVVGVGGGIWARGTNISIENCTITENESTAGGGGAYLLKCSGQVVSTIATGNSTTGVPGQLVITSSTVDVSYCNVEGGAPGVGNIDAPPLFVSGPLGDYYLAATSPCIDAGDPFATVPPGTTQVDQSPDEAEVDMGYHYPITERFIRGDCNQDGAVDVADAVQILSALFVPGTDPPSCEGSCDTNTDAMRDVSDAVFILTWLFGSGAAPEPPFPDCGLDSALTALRCDHATACP